MPRVPSASTGTFMNQLMLDDQVALAEARMGALGEEVLDAGVLVLVWWP